MFSVSTSAFSSSSSANSFLFGTAFSLGGSSSACSSSSSANSPLFGSTFSLLGSSSAFSSSSSANSSLFGPAFSSPQPQSSPSRRTSPVTNITPVDEKPTTGSKSAEDDLKKRISFLSEFFLAFKEQIHTDIQLQPNNGHCMSAHKALLAARSQIFKNMLESDSCKAPSSDTDMITLSELNTEELESFLEFLYTGNLPLDKWEKHVYSLYAAADKYEISYLQDCCERNMMNSLNTSNALDILEISYAHSGTKLKETALKFIVQNMKSIVSSQKYEDFASSNPHLSVQITRAFFDAKCP